MIQEKVEKLTANQDNRFNIYPENVREKIIELFSDDKIIRPQNESPAADSITTTIEELVRQGRVPIYLRTENNTYLYLIPPVKADDLKYIFHEYDEDSQKYIFYFKRPNQGPIIDYEGELISLHKKEHLELRKRIALEKIRLKKIPILNAIKKKKNIDLFATDNLEKLVKQNRKPKHIRTITYTKDGTTLNIMVFVVRPATPSGFDFISDITPNSNGTFFRYRKGKEIITLKGTEYWLTQEAGTELIKKLS